MLSPAVSSRFRGSARVGLMVVLGSAALCFGCVAHAQTVSTTLHAFDGANGATPIGGMVMGPDGNLYGSTSEGGPNGTGVLFRIAPDGSGYRIVHAFAALTTDVANADGRQPRGAMMVGSDGRLYGSTSNGGPNNTGTLYSVDPATDDFRLEYVFPRRSDTVPSVEGGRVQSGLSAGIDGFYYGATSVGAAHDSGALFRFKLATASTPAALTVLHAFAERPFRVVGGSDDRNADGWKVEGNLLQLASGVLYGATSEGGDNDAGTLFRINADGSGFTTLFQFAARGAGERNIGGAVPEGTIAIASDGMLYGSTQLGGSNGSGVIYRIDPATDTVTVVYEFTGRGNSSTNESNRESARPVSGLTAGSDGYLYGAGRDGGANGTGGVFRFRPGVNTIDLLHSFAAVDGSGRNSDGSEPNSAVISASPASLLFGSSGAGGSGGVGVVYRLDTSRFVPPEPPGVVGGAVPPVAIAGLIALALFARRRRRPH